MRMWKIAAIATLLLAPATFGAVTFNLLGTDGTGKGVAKVAGDTVQIDVNLDLSADQVAVGGITFFLQADKPNIIAISGRTIKSAILTDPTTTTATLTNAANAPLAPQNARDIGTTSSDPEVGITADETTMTLTLKLLADLPKEGLTISAAKVFASTTGEDAEQFRGVVGSAFQIVPEPMSALLVAAGAAFFARRRKA